MNNKKSLFKNTIYKAMLSFVNIVVPLLVGPYVVRLLDVDLYGMYNIVYSEFQVFLAFASFGLYAYGIREISKIRNDKEKISKLFSNFFVIGIFSNIVIGLLYLIYSFSTSSGTMLLLYLVMTVQILGNVFYIEFVNEALENYKFITVKTTIVKILYVLMIFLLVRNPDNIVIYAFVISFTVFLNNIISFIYAKKYIKFNFKALEIKKYLKPLLIVLVITNIDLLYTQLDRVMLGKFTTGVNVTMYYIPYFLVSTLVAIPYAVINVSIPRLSYIRANENIDQYRYTLNKVISSLLFIIVPMCLGVVALSSEIIYLYAGEKYMACVPVLILAASSRIIISIESVYTNLIMYPNNRETQLLKFTISCGILNLILNSILVLTKTITPFTAMFTTTIAEIMLIVGQSIYARKKLNIVPSIFNKQNMSYLLLSLCFVPLTFLIKSVNLGLIINTISVVIVCILFYSLGLFILKDENFFMVLNKIKNRKKSINS